MGFYFKKSKAFGPFRFNFSKSGVGVSAGIKGARVSVGPRGTDLHAGRYGFYYRKHLAGKGIGRWPGSAGASTQSQTAFPTLFPEGLPDSEANPEALTFYKIRLIIACVAFALTGFSWFGWPLLGLAAYMAPRGSGVSAKNVSQLKPLLLLGLIVALTSGTGLVTLSILDGIPRMAFWFVFLLATLMAGLVPFVGLLALGLAVFGSQTNLWIRAEMSVAILGCMLTLLLEKQAWARFLDAEAALFEAEIERLTFTVPYDAPEAVTDPAFLREFQIFPKMVEAMVGVIRGRTFWARLDGKMIQAKSQHPVQVPFLRFSESLNAWAFGVLFESAHVVFLPDRMLYFNGTNQSAPYSSLRLTIVPVLYESTGRPPEDAWLVRRSWRHVRKDGMPDERYSDNPAFYQIQLACLKVQAPGFAVELLFTDWESVRRLETTLSGVIPVQIQFPVPEQEKKESREQRKSPPEPPPAKNPDRFLTACRILQVTPAMAWEEVRSAYKKAVRENHPDMLAGMSERLREQANQFLGEINEAFAYLEGVRDRFSS